MARKVVVLLSLAVFLVLNSVSLADPVDDLSKENTELRKRVDNLENELAEIKALLKAQAAAPKAMQSRPADAKTVAIPELNEADIEKIAALVNKNKERKPVWSTLDVQLYGYIKVDAAYDTTRTSPGNYVKWVDSEATKKKDSEFNLTARQTRLGVKIAGPETDGMKASGQIEFDLYGGTAENKPEPMLRHAFAKLEWPEKRFSIIAGQTWDVISPLNPSTLNYSVMWWSGNMGYRRPQIRLTKDIALNKDTDLRLEGAITRTIGDDELSSTPGAKSGEDSGYPTVQGRAAVTIPSFGPKPATFGLSGHWGEEEYGSTDFETWSLNVDVKQPINDWLMIKGEAFVGENLDAYLGGIGQGVRMSGTTPVNGISSAGGWIAANIKKGKKWQFNVGAGLDDVENSDLASTGTGEGDRTLNSNIFGNAIYTINKHTQVGVEVSQWHTERNSQPDADNLRFQSSLIYKF